MADFCKQCTVAVLGVKPEQNDFADMGEPPEGKSWVVLCEGCGYTLVDGTGTCLTDDCKGGEVHKSYNR